MKRQYITLVVSLLALTFLLSCEKPPERCSEEIAVTPEATKDAETRLRQMVADTLFQFDIANVSTTDMHKISQLLAATQTGEKKHPEQFNTEYLEQKAREFKARQNLDKRFFFVYNKSKDRSFDIVQIEMEWRLNLLTSNPEAFRITKTGYFDADGNLLCFWYLTPKVSL